MNVLVTCIAGLYMNFSSSFVHAQAAAYASLGHRVRVIVPYAIGKRDWDGNRFSGPICCWDRDGVEVYIMRCLSISNYGSKGFNLARALQALQRKLDRLLEGFAPDIIHAHALGFGSEVGAFFKERLGVPLVVTSHGGDVALPVEQGRGAEVKRYCGKADAVVAVSSALAGKIRSCRPEPPISVILNGFRIQNIPEGEAGRGLALAQVGRLNQQKRPYVTLQAFARLQEAHPGMVLTFIGDGPDRDTLERKSREIGISDAVRFLGMVPNSAVLTELAKTRFFILPSVREGFGIVYLEAMASGCVTIGTEGEGIADLIVSNENGFLVPPDDPDAIVHIIEWCLEHPYEASAIAERGRKDAMSLTWEKNASEYIDLFKELIS